jgi:hypothetical protein
MVRKGSSVRVRQRALPRFAGQKLPTSLCLRLARGSAAGPPRGAQLEFDPLRGRACHPSSRPHAGVVLLDHPYARPTSFAIWVSGTPSYTRSVTKLERRSRGRVPAGAQPGRGGVARLRSLRGRSGSPCQTRPRRLRQSSCSQSRRSCAGNTGDLPVGRPLARNHSRRSSASGASSGVNRKRCCCPRRFWSR